MTHQPPELPVRGRYAPSPTGSLHLGNLRTALLAWLFARSRRGAFILRIEDLDTPRVRPSVTSEMLADLRWLGLDWDEGPGACGLYGPYYQSERGALYDAALAVLSERGLLYPCYCTRAELASIASAPHDAETVPRYPGTCRSLTERQRRERENAGRRPSLRFRAPEAPIVFYDHIAGAVRESVASATGDFVVRRSDGIIAYQLAVVVDDALMGITQIVRGRDLLASTARQLALFDALGYPRPRALAHVPLALDATGQRMSKREQSAGLAAYQHRRGGPEAVLGALAASAGFWPPHTSATLPELLATFDPARLSRGPASIEL